MTRSVSRTWKRRCGAGEEHGARGARESERSERRAAPTLSLGKASIASLTTDEVTLRCSSVIRFMSSSMET